MKKNIMTFLIAILIGASFAFYLFKGIDKNIAKAQSNYLGVLYQVGVFRVQENARKEAGKYPSAIVVQEADLYRVYIGIAIDGEVQLAYDKFFDSENISIYKKKIALDDRCYRKINSFEKVIKKSFNEATYYNINKELLNYYKDGCHD